MSHLAVAVRCTRNAEQTLRSAEQTETWVQALRTERKVKSMWSAILRVGFEQKQTLRLIYIIPSPRTFWRLQGNLSDGFGERKGFGESVQSRRGTFLCNSLHLSGASRSGWQLRGFFEQCSLVWVFILPCHVIPATDL